MKLKLLVLAAMLSLGVVNAETLDAKKNPVLAVSLKKPEVKEIEGAMNISGNVVSWQEASISGEISGVKIEEIFVDVGSSVKKGQILARLNKQSILMDLEQANATLEEAKANLYVAEQNALRVKKLEGTSALSDLQKNQYFAAEKMALAKVSSATAMVNSLNIKLSQTNVVAPEDGTISERRATVGTIIGTGEMFKMIVKDKLQWQPTISAEKLGLIKRGQKVVLNLKSGEKISANIDEISPKVNIQTRQATLLINLTKDKHDGKIYPGMFVSGEILSAKQQQILVKKDSVVLRDGVNYVFTVNGEQATQKKVSLGKRVGDYVIVKDGLTKDDSIVTLGAAFLKNGDTVSVSKD